MNLQTSGAVCREIAEVYLFSYAPLEGEVRLILSAAKCETGWGGVTPSGALVIVIRSAATPPRLQAQASLPLQRRVNPLIVDIVLRAPEQMDDAGGRDGDKD